MKSFIDVSYVNPDDGLRKMDIFAPENSKRTVMWMHGGGLETGSRKGFDGIARQLCEEGTGFISVEYRMYPGHSFPSFIEDGAMAASYILSHARELGVSEHMFIGGSSAGAYIAMMLCFDRHYLASCGYSPKDMAGYIFDAGQPTTHFNILKYRGEDPRLCRIDESAPLFHITDAEPDRPIQIVCADNDMPARLEQNRLMMATMKQFGYDINKVHFRLMESYSHCGYDNAQKDGRFILADIISDFVALY